MSIFAYYKRPLSDDDNEKKHTNATKSFDLNTLILTALIHTRIETPPSCLQSARPYCSPQCLYAARPACTAASSNYLVSWVFKVK